jgi:hypothetical protein
LEASKAFKEPAREKGASLSTAAPLATDSYIRLRKIHLDPNKRKRASRARNAGRFSTTTLI